MLALQRVWAVIPLLPSTFLLCQIQTMRSAGGLPAITAFTRWGRFHPAGEGGGGEPREVRASIWWASAAILPACVRGSRCCLPPSALSPPLKPPPRWKDQEGPIGAERSPSLGLAAGPVFLPASAQVRVGEMTIRGTTNEAVGPWGGTCAVT